MTYIERIIAQRTATPLPPVPASPDLVLTVDGVETVMGAQAAMAAHYAAIAAGKVASLRPVNAPVVAAPLPSTPTAVSVAVSSIPCDDTACDLDRWSDPDQDEPATVQSRGETVSRVAHDRVMAQAQMLRDAGFTGDIVDVDTLIYAPGHRVNETGDANFAKFRRNIARLPGPQVAAQRLTARIQAEQRADVEYDARDLTVSAQDGYTLNVGPTLTSRAFDQIGALCKFGPGTTYLQTLCTAEQRAHNANIHLGSLEKERPVVLRTRNDGEGGREVYATVTPSYTRLDADKVFAGVVEAGVLDDTKIELTYTNARVRATALFMPDHVVDLACGDVFKIGVRFSTSDAADGKYKVSVVAFRNACENLIIITESEVVTMSRVHRGQMDLEELVQAICAAIGEAFQKAEPFLASWKQSREYKITDAHAALAALVENRDIVLTGMRSGAQREQLVSALCTAFDAEPGDSAADLANAITRAAHERTDLFSLDLREELEKQASALILLPGQLLSAYAVA